MRWLMMPAIQHSVMKMAQAMEMTMGGASHLTVCARKHSGMSQAMKGCSSVVLRTLRKRSMDSGANQESRCGGREYRMVLDIVRR